MERKHKAEKSISEIQDKINIFEIELKHLDVKQVEEKLSTIDKYKIDIRKDNLSNVQKNNLYKSIVESIIWTRIDDTINIQVNFK